MHRSIFIVLAALAAGTVVAQETRRPEPTEPRAQVPGIHYRSAFTGYRRFAEEPLAPWRESNEAVKADSGHRGHAAQPAKEAEPAAKPPAGSQHGEHR